MGKLKQRYEPEEKARLVETMKPVERWTKYEHQLWARDHYGFRHFTAPNITPIEHYRPPEPVISFDSFVTYPVSESPPRPRKTPRPTPPRKPAA